jgi:hypothetical protein
MAHDARRKEKGKEMRPEMPERVRGKLRFMIFLVLHLFS